MKLWVTVRYSGCNGEDGASMDGDWVVLEYPELISFLSFKGPHSAVVQYRGNPWSG